MSATFRLIAGALLVALLIAACDGSAFTADPNPSPGGLAAPTTAAGDPTPASGCAFDGVVSDADLATAVCQYQTLLVQALSSGVIVDPALMEQVSSAIATAAIDPQNARALVEAAIAQIEQRIAAVVPDELTPTVADLTDTAFGCMVRANELLGLAVERQTIGGVPIPEMEAWQATFADAAALAETGDVAGATTVVCDLNADMESVLFQS